MHASSTSGTDDSEQAALRGRRGAHVGRAGRRRGRRIGKVRSVNVSVVSPAP